MSASGSRPMGRMPRPLQSGKGPWQAQLAPTARTVTPVSPAAKTRKTVTSTTRRNNSASADWIALRADGLRAARVANQTRQPKTRKPRPCAATSASVGSSIAWRIIADISRTAARTTASVARSNIMASVRRATHVSAHTARIAATAVIVVTSTAASSAPHGCAKRAMASATNETAYHAALASVTHRSRACQRGCAAAVAWIRAEDCSATGVGAVTTSAIGRSLVPRRGWGLLQVAAAFQGRPWPHQRTVATEGGQAQVAQRSLGPNTRQRAKVIDGWRRGGQPLERVAEPRIVAGFCAVGPRRPRVPDEDENGKTEHECADRLDHVQRQEAGLDRIGGDAPLHAHHAQDVHGEEGQVEADQHQPEVPRRQTLAIEPAGDLGEPEIGPREQGEDAATEQHVVQMGDDEVRVVQLIVDRHDGRPDAADAADDEHGQETQREQQRRLEL